MESSNNNQETKKDQSNPLLGTSEIDELFKLSEEKSVLQFKKGDILFYENTQPSGVYFLKEGAVRIYARDAEGSDQTLGITSAGHYIGLGSLIRNKKHLGTAVALEDSSVCFIPKKEFFRLTEMYPQISHQLLVKFCYQLDKAEDKLISLSNKSGIEKLAEVLLVLGRDINLQSGSNTLKITIKDLAAMTGLGTAMISSYIAEFVEKKIIDTFGDEIRILSMESLADISGNVST